MCVHIHICVCGGAGLLVYVTTTLGDGTEAEQDSEPVLWGSLGSSGVYFPSIREWNGMHCGVEGEFSILIPWLPSFSKTEVVPKEKRLN